jgi:pentatricopeptide repeat protein
MDTEQLAEAVRAACVQAALAAYEDAGIRGLCEAGRWEAAVSALHSIDLHKLIRELALARKASDLAIPGRKKAGPAPRL